MNSCFRTFALAASLVFTSGSALAQYYGRGEPRLQVLSAEGSNQNTATVIHVVAVFDSSVLPYLPRTAPEWFGTTRAHLQVLGNRISVGEYQVLANNGLVDLPLPRGSRRAAAFVAYVNYLDPEGQAAVRMPGRGCSRLVLEERRVVYTECR